MQYTYYCNLNIICLQATYIHTQVNAWEHLLQGTKLNCIHIDNKSITDKQNTTVYINRVYNPVFNLINEVNVTSIQALSL